MPLHIPSPCHENWENMTPNQQGRHCQACCKTVVDFTQMTNDEVLNYFAQHQGQKVCGRLHKSQLAQTEVEIIVPQSVLKKGLTRWQVFGLSLLLVFGVVLTGCTGTQQTKAIFKFEKNHAIMGLDTPPPLSIPPPQYDSSGNFDEIILGMVIDPISIPEYTGGEPARLKYFNERLSKLDFKGYTDSLPRKVWVEFVIDTAGRPQYVKIKEGGLDSIINQQIIKIVQEMPAWKPGYSQNKPADTKMMLPIKIIAKE